MHTRNTNSAAEAPTRASLAGNTKNAMRPLTVCCTSGPVTWRLIRAGLLSKKTQQVDGTQVVHDTFEALKKLVVMNICNLSARFPCEAMNTYATLNLHSSGVGAAVKCPIIAAVNT